ncbi:hypothetical protein GCM10010347_43580 [Streptomyces cirratus]|uniref:Uncharacterized protein n=1 Tax=Streptomyces cirratus TaxID=68187 RepID=A0ABQ3F308_9ACTN|nr:hypothetical protein GCM10010347_43580 [Streptomyces cirratus]
MKARAAKAAKLGITPAWHTDRVDYARRNDTQWTGSNNLPAHVIAKTGDLRVVSGFRALDFWLCDLRALYPCPDGVRRCGKHHVTPKPRDVLFDDLVRQTAAGSIVPVEHLRGSRLDKFWVTSEDRDRLEDLLEGALILNPAPPEGATPKSSPNAPTCRTATAAASPAQPAAITSPAPLNTPIATGGAFSTTRPSVEFPSEFEQTYDSGVTSNANVFPDDLLQLQERLHRIRAEHTAYLAGLPWSVEPVKGWARWEHFSHRGDVPDSPGWTPEQKERVDWMWQELRDLSAAVVDHPYWKTVEREKVVEARMLMKKQARPAAPSAAENASEAA